MLNDVKIFPWNESFLTGVESIDQQHKKLVSILNKLANHIAIETSDLEWDTLIKELVEYSIFHFESEERYWFDKIPNNDQIKQHQKSHNLFIQKIRHFKDNYKAGSEEHWMDELMSFLTTWLATHILESDKFMALFVEAVRSGLSITDANNWADNEMLGATKASRDIILTAYQNLSTNTLMLMREVKTSKRTLKKLTQIEHDLNEAMDYAQIGSWSYAYESGITSWSPQISDILGTMPSDSASPEAFYHLLSQEHKHDFIATMRQNLGKSNEQRIECEITRPIDGEIRWIECRGKCVSEEPDKSNRLTGFIRDITEQKNNEKQISKLAYYDSLTSLPNRRLFFDRLNQSIALADRNQAYCALFLIDIDNFKTLNDTYGHDLGDTILQEAAHRISKCTRIGDTLARIGNDEFVLILSGLNDSMLEAAAESKLVSHKILHSLSQPYSVNNLVLDSSVSIGIVLFNDSSIISSELVIQADIAMHQAKQSGKNTALFYQSEMQEAIANQLSVKNKLRDAIYQQQLELHYQPQLNANDKVIGAEALVRWYHPTDGIISPDQFIPTAEKTGLIIPLGDWVLEQACLQLNHWKNTEYTNHLTLSVNVSYRQFSQHDFVYKVSSLIDKYHVDASRLKIELTETMLVDDIELTISQMEALRELGIQFSLDDFGTGYSSLQNLKRLPLNQLKIDRSFVLDLERSFDDQSIVKATILMAQALNITVIAEGVETLAQRNFLQSHGCSFYQGYYYSKPLPSSRFMSYVLENMI